jgi:hypothetical protein
LSLLGIKHQGKAAIDACARFFGKQSIAVEIATHSYSYTRGWVTLEGIKTALREDFDEHLTEAGRARYADVSDMLLDIQRPDRLFALDRFTRLLLHQFVPTQMVWRDDLPLVVSPARVHAFGLP